MRKFLITMMCIIMVVCFMPTVAFGTTGEGSEGNPYIVGTEVELNEAINMGGYIQLNNDITLNNLIKITENKNITIDLNGHFLTLEKTSGVDLLSGEAKLTLKNGSINGKTTKVNEGVIFVNTGCTVIIDNVNFTSTGVPLFPCGDAANVKVLNSTISAPNSYAVSTNASTTDNHNVEIDLIDSTFNGSSPILVNVPCTLNMNNCIVNGSMHGVVVRGGTASISNSTITMNYPDDDAQSMADYFNSINWGSGNMLNLAAITVGNKHATSYQYPSNVTVLNTTIQTSGTYADLFPAVYSWANTDAANGVSISYDNCTIKGKIIYGDNGRNITGKISNGYISYKADEDADKGLYLEDGKITSKSATDDALYLVHDHSTTCNFGHVYCPATCTGENICHTLSHYVAPPTTPTTPTDNVTNSGTSGTDNATTSADLSGSTSTSNGTTSATVDKTTADKIVDKAVANKSEEIVIDATANSTTAANSTTTAQVTIPTETLGAIAEKTEADVTIKTDVAEVKMDNAAAAAVSEQATGETVQIIAEKVAEETDKVEFELKVVCSDGKVISDFKGGNVAVTVALPKAMADKKVVCVYIDDNGHMSKMVGQKNADGTYTFNTGHFSSYAIMAEEEADAAIAAQKQAIKNIKIKLTSKQVKTKAGKKAVKITWTAAAGDKVLDGVEVYRSTERYKGYGTEPFYTSTKGGNTGSYTNTKSLKKGTRYYYRVRGYVLVDGQKVYTDYSTKAWRTVK